MFRKIGSTIKTFAATIFVTVTVASVFLGILLLVRGGRGSDVFGLILLLGCPLLNLVSVLLMYGFGELIDRAISIDRKLDRLIESSGGWRCKTCGNINPEGFEFCNQCGRAH